MLNIKKIRKEIFFYLALIILPLIFLGRTLFPGKNEIIYGGDLLTQFYFWKGYLTDSLLRGVIPFWNPYSFSGTPFLAHPSVAPFYPAVLLYLIFPLNLAFSLNYYLHLVIGGLGMYFLTKRYASNFISLISTICFMFSGYFTARIYAGHVDLLTTSVWIPWVIYSFLKISDLPFKRSNMIQAIISLTLLILAGYSAYLVFILEFIVFLLIYFFIKKIPQIKKVIISICLVIAVSLGISSVQWLPTWELSGNSIRGQGLPYGLASWGSLPLSGLKLFINPLDRNELNKISFNLGGGPKENPFDHFPGRFAVLTVIGFIFYYFLSRLFLKNKKIKLNQDFWFYLFVSLFFLLVSFGNYLKPSLHQFLYHVIPFYRYIRIPIQNLIIPQVLFPVLVGIIISKIKSVKVISFIGVIIFLELFLFSRQYIFLTGLPEQKYDQILLSSIKKNIGQKRIIPAFRVISALLDHFDLNSSIKFRFESTSGYDPLILKNYYDFIDSSAGNSVSSIPYYNVEVPPVDINKFPLDFLNVSQVLTDYQLTAQAKFKEQISGLNFTLLTNPSFMPRFYSVSQAEIMDSDSALKKLLVEGNYDFSKKVYLLKNEVSSIKNFNLDCQLENPDFKTNILSFKENNIKIRSIGNCPYLLTSSEVYYPGWRVKIDGKNAAILRSNLAFRTIYLSKGEHIIEYYYYPEIYIIAAIIAFITLITAILIIRRYYDAQK
ncbi:hypothetical protein A2W14_01610 [Candidatus Gottesmanbacteria bacterium RBG_16_37_8]|uniref:Membrane protein 6-pyruvoyl-tetrahydropterin synthase-related domain-containing protein n=1 Tax=Candidatus Gottesmanbacteria bacterium RBG_16_37_8 TaxID=1798371 RepID=A0A1F5YQK7_9BACT|nr:MAG: hypothetical protein A2W14_01610 [Candidatus Gottesmanbacteria bacterium RBG_16_37_8]